MPKRTRSKKSTKKRTFKRKGRKVGKLSGRMTLRSADTYHFKGNADAGTLLGNTFNAATPGQSGGVFVIRLPNLAIYNQLAGNFEFVRLNKCRVNFLPKYNMSQSAAVGVIGSGPSITGTLVAAIDETPLIQSAAGTQALATSWSDDTTSGAGGPLESWSISTSMPSPQWVRSIQRSREVEIYKKLSFSFQPKHYTLTLSAGAQLLPLAANQGTSASNAQYQAHGKTWVNSKYNTSVGTTGAQTEFVSLGPVYYGPVYNLMILSQAISESPTYDIRFHYSISFRRLSTIG